MVGQRAHTTFGGVGGRYSAAPTTRIASINRREIDAGRDDRAAAVLNTTSSWLMKSGA